MSKTLVAYFSASGTTARTAKNLAPTIINTFLESYDFTGKEIILFATSGGSGFGRTVQSLAPSCPGAHIREGKMLNGNPSVDTLINGWVKAVNQ